MGTIPVAYSFTLGLLAAVNPCGFPLLPAYLAHFACDTTDRRRGRRTVRALTAGGCVTIGFIVAFGVIGLLIESGMLLLLDWAPWIMIALGLGMVVLGVRTFAGLSLRLPLPRVSFREGRTALAMAGFGVAYATASLSCALPLFLAGVGDAFTRTGLLGGMATFLAYALGMGVFVTAASLIAAHTGAAALRVFRPLSRVLPQIMGATVILVGLYLIYYWASDVVDPLTTPAVSVLIDGLQSAVSAVLGSTVLAGLILGAIVIAGFVIAALTVNHDVPPKSSTRSEAHDA